MQLRSSIQREGWIDSKIDEQAQIVGAESQDYLLLAQDWEREGTYE